MANKKFWLGMLVMALVFGLTVIGLTSCDDDLWSQEDSFTMTGTIFFKVGDDYRYKFENFSNNHAVKITIDDVTHTMKRNTAVAWTDSELVIYNSSKTITVTYSPSNSVKARMKDIDSVEFWDK